MSEFAVLVLTYFDSESEVRKEIVVASKPVLFIAMVMLLAAVVCSNVSSFVQSHMPLFDRYFPSS